MKKHTLARALCALSALALLLASAACGGTEPSPAPAPTPAETASEEPSPPAGTAPEEPSATADGASEGEAPVASLLQEILDAAGAGLEGEDALPMSFIDPVTEENCGKLGLTEADFALVEQAYSAIAGIISQAHEVALLYAPGYASEIKEAIAGGYDSGKWMCVMPEKSAVVASGDYVLLAASRIATADALLDAFAETIGPGEPDVFYTSN